MRHKYVAVALLLCSCAAPGANLEKYYRGNIGAPYQGQPTLTSTVLTEEMRTQSGLRMLGVIFVTGPALKQKDLLAFARRINAVVVTVRAKADGTYAYDAPELKWIPGTRTRVRGSITGSDGSTSYVSGSATTQGRMETATKTRTGTSYAQGIFFWGY